MTHEELVADLVEQIETINGRSFVMAKEVAGDPARAAKLETEATILLRKLLKVADQLEAEAPLTFEPLKHAVSESVLDLDYARSPSDTTSLRLGDLLRR